MGTPLTLPRHRRRKKFGGAATPAEIY